MPPRGPQTALGWISFAAAAVSWIYAGTVGFVLLYPQGQPALMSWIAQWAAVPVQFIAIALLSSLLCSRDVRAGPTRAAWWCVLMFTAGSSIATYLWNTVAPASLTAVLNIEDVIYLTNYWVMTVAFAILFVHAGGSFRTGRTWLDGATMTAVQLVGIWSFFEPSAANRAAGNTVAATLCCSVTLTSMMTMAALLCMQLPSFRGRPAVLLLVAAATANAAWEIMWLASWWKGRDLVGLFYNFGDVLCFAAIISAVAASQLATSPASDAVNLERRTDSFLPALAVLVAIALVAGSVATTRRWHAWILVGLVALSALLLLTRQQSVRRELRALNRQLAKREADERLTELVRRSMDLIMVVNAEGIVTFASPATESMLGVPVSHVQDTAAVDVLGPDHSPVLGHFLKQVRTPSAEPLTIEIRTHRPGGKDRTFKIGAVNRLANHLIGGIVLTLTDVTEQRLLEREVLDIATRERVRLSADIHDGLGQELVGISMLLHGAATAPDPDPAVHKSQLQAIVGHLNRTVGMARNLAWGLSPLHVVRGSLGGALQRLVPEYNTSVSVRLDIDPTFDTYVVGDIYADHLYRIAHEAVSNALRHSGCTGIEIGLRRLDSAVVLSVSDDGRGFCEPFPEHAGLGLRLMEYRARIVGGSLSVESAPGSGTRVKVVMPQTR